MVPLEILVFLVFYPNKHITTGEGGMILTDCEDLSNKCKDLRNLCFSSERRFKHYELGWNYRMTNMQAAIGVAQLEQIDKIILRKREIGARYNKNLFGLKKVQLPQKGTEYSDNIYWVYGIVAESANLAKKIQDELNLQKIGSRPFFWCMHEQPVFNNMNLFKDESYPVSEKLARNGFYIPSGLGITDEEIDQVSNFLIEIVKNG